MPTIRSRNSAKTTPLSGQRKIFPLAKLPSELLLNILGRLEFRWDILRFYNITENNKYLLDNIECIAKRYTWWNVELGRLDKALKLAERGWKIKMTVYKDRALTDTDRFKNVDIIYFDTCQNLTDLTGLKKATEVHLTRCPSIKDVSALANLDRIYIERCDGLYDLNSLRNIERGELVDLPDVKITPSSFKHPLVFKSEEGMR
jgi:hypothetical protein